jgi:type I restriction enzyme R subunit
MAINLFGKDAVLHAGDESPDEEAEKLPIPIHAFDVIVADECHRGYTRQELSLWRDTLDHFDAIKIGLTATPAAHTTSYFHEVVYRYDYERAVREGHLVDYDVVKIKSDVRMNGVFLGEGEHVELVDPQTGQQKLDILEDERKFETAEIEEKVTAPDSNRKILEEVNRYALQHETAFGRFPKTLIFAANDLQHTSHADQLVRIGREIFGRGEAFVQKITGRVDRPLQRIREFRNRPEPGVVVTVDLLSTGVDIPDLEFIVFLRPVKSRILFEQMLGRGTRKGANFPDKSHFVVFDCFDGTLLEYFRNATAITAEEPEAGARTIAEIIQDIWENRDREYNVRCLVKRLHRVDKQMSGEAREQFRAFIPEGDVARYARDLPAELKRDFSGSMSLLRNPGFQHLLVHYPRPGRTFLVAHTAQDTVASEWLVRGADGREFRPAEYLQAWAEFVRENPVRAQAIPILLEHPRDWSFEALEELRDRLGATPERFSIPNLQTAYQLQYQKAQPDIISMIRHAARAEELFTAEERAARALWKVTVGQSFTDEQREWLDRIRLHLAANLSLARGHFDDAPVLARSGGWGRARKVFGGQLDELVRQVNEAMAA